MADPIKTASELLEFLDIQSVDIQNVIAEVNNLTTDNYTVTLLSRTHITDPERILTFTDTLPQKVLETITRQNYKWLLSNGYV